MVTSHRRRDDGGILILTLILVVVMSVIVVGLLQYVTVGLTTSDVATERTETNADSSNVMHWAIEQFAKKQLRPDDPLHCGEAPAYLSIAVPADIVSNGSVTELECAQTNPINGEPVVHLIARSTGDQNRVVEATVEIPQYSHGARVADWRVDIPIAVPVYSTTTSSSTTTTSTTGPANQPPVAYDFSAMVVLDDLTPFSFTLHVDDPEGGAMTVDTLTSTDPISVTIPGGITVEVSASTAGGASAPGTYSFQYVVEDDGGLTSNIGTVTVNVESAGPPSTSTTTTTTTTLPPSPACTFVVTSSQSGGSSGIGVLEVTNSGGDFTGWEVEITQRDPARPWQFTWATVVDATTTATGVQVSGDQTITTTSPFSVSAGLTQSYPQPKIRITDPPLTCTVLTPAP